jgi:hypothetical protein
VYLSCVPAGEAKVDRLVLKHHMHTNRVSRALGSSGWVTLTRTSLKLVPALCRPCASTLLPNALKSLPCARVPVASRYLGGEQ